MASLPIPQRRQKPSEEHPTELGSPYCADPNCEYCKALREAQEKLKREKR